MAVSGAGAEMPYGVTSLDADATSSSSLQLAGGGQAVIDSPAPTVSGHWQARRFAATLALDDGQQVAPPPQVACSMRRERACRRTLAAADALAALALIAIASVIFHGGASWAFLLVAPLVVLIAKIEGLYDRDDRVLSKSTLAEWRVVLRAAAACTLGTYLIWRLAGSVHEQHGVHVLAFLLTGLFVLQLPARALARKLVQATSAPERCLIVGHAELSSRLAERLAEMRCVDLVGAVPDGDVDCSLAGVHELVTRLDAERIIVVPHSDWGDAGAVRLVQSAKWLGIRVSLMPSLLAVVGAGTTADALDGMTLLGVPRFGLSRSSRALKRAFDLIVAGAALIVTAPLLLLTAIAVRLDSPGPVIFSQRRIGRDGRPFTMYKFRSMVVGAEHMKDALGALNETTGLFKMSDDPRVTRVGRFLRRTYLDELPQLVNVLLGDMSVVGPRPLVESEDALLVGSDRHRSALPPGITGPWQLRGPLRASLQELAQLDYIYASTWSIWGDLDIVFATMIRVLRHQGR